jgi:hypothetical protein
VAVRFSVGGFVVCSRGCSLARRGDFLMHLAVEGTSEALVQFGEAASLRWLGPTGKAGSRRPRPVPRKRQRR